MNIRAVIFDWAGTVVDYGCHAPPAVLLRLFAARGIELRAEESRHAMGLLKRDQIREICRLERVRRAWTERFGAPPTAADVEALFADFLPLQIACIEQFSDVIDGVAETVLQLRGAGIKIGSTTGYTRPMLNVILPKAAQQGYAPDAIVTPDDVGAGRPAPWMIFENLKRLDVFPPSRCVKVGDTPSDIEEGRNAGAWTVGVVESSNEAVLGGPAVAAQRLTSSGAHHLIRTIRELPELISRLG